MKDNGMNERESLELFRRIVPRNPDDWNGGVVLYSTWNRAFFNIVFGSGCNLDGDDVSQGFDDYIMADQYRLSGERPLDEIMEEIRDEGCADSCIDGLEEVDGGLWLLKHKEWEDGDIRRFLMEALSFAGYGVPKSRIDDIYRDIIYVGADYDTERPGSGTGNSDGGSNG